jgi:orotidine-5'-phosphate decarboxylase
METKKIILPLDAYPNAEDLLTALNFYLSEEGTSDLLAFIKINDGVHNYDMGGPALLLYIAKSITDHNAEIGIFLDLKIFDVSATLVNTLKRYSIAPDILTVCANCSVEGIIKLRKLLPEKTKLAMVSVPTDIPEDECLSRFGKGPEQKIHDDLLGIRHIYKDRISINKSNINPEPFDLIVCSAHELSGLKKHFPGYGLIVPGIRDEWMKSKDEHQKRITGVRQALDLGATYVVMGAQFTKGNPEMGISPEQSRALTLTEISKE